MPRNFIGLPKMLKQGHLLLFLIGFIILLLIGFIMGFVAFLNIVKGYFGQIDANRMEMYFLTNGTLNVNGSALLGSSKPVRMYFVNKTGEDEQKETNVVHLQFCFNENCCNSGVIFCYPSKLYAQVNDNAVEGGIYNKNWHEISAQCAESKWDLDEPVERFGWFKVATTCDGQLQLDSSVRNESMKLSLDSNVCADIELVQGTADSEDEQKYKNSGEKLLAKISAQVFDGFQNGQELFSFVGTSPQCRATIRFGGMAKLVCHGQQLEQGECTYMVYTGLVPNVALLRLMTYNAWRSGNKVADSIGKIARHIKQVDPDIVGLQEMDPSGLEKLVDKLEVPWNGLLANATKWETQMILTKLKVLSGIGFHTSFGVGATVEHPLGPSQINLFTGHFDYRNFVTDEIAEKSGEISYEQIYNTSDVRLANLKELNANQQFQKAWELALNEITPLFVFGDFNEPSHFDWIEETKNLHCGLVVSWRVSRQMELQHFQDSFRMVHQNVTKEPGCTWSAYFEGEPQNRIDFIYHFISKRLTPVHSFIYAGQKPLMKTRDKEIGVKDGALGDRDWTSDHYALVTDYLLEIGTK